ncbi:uncharacterized protein F5891DRAFT_317722 [Suillus fuscotomentosus]|uniref:Uncharacterized protein n=1 Tax=Suillus fuscotomentosus TaxID=1912939 RepID=A0AAD4HC06_9AGAM|nr:uncharacterized protein F5891DRAFT_317722 [Suillus fuscotomentosus]KAG1886376.1 hypothetical protein F5891DRAFT_317722 [Suillus fuscotomentosus]
MQCYRILHILGQHYSNRTKTGCERYSRVPLYTHDVLRHYCLCWQHISAVYMGMRFSVHSVGRRHKFMPLDPLRCPKSAECIRGLPVRGRPAISSQSRPKMSNGLPVISEIVPSFCNVLARVRCVMSCFVTSLSLCLWTGLMNITLHRYYP